MYYTNGFFSGIGSFFGSIGRGVKNVVNSAGKGISGFADWTGSTIGGLIGSIIQGGGITGLGIPGLGEISFDPETGQIIGGSTEVGRPTVIISPTAGTWFKQLLPYILGAVAVIIILALVIFKKK